MEAIGSLGVPLPRPQPGLHRPRPVPQVAQGLLESVLVELTRPVAEAFTVRIFDQDVTPPEADVVAAYVLTGADVVELARRLELAWVALDLHAIPGVRYACFRSYEHGLGFATVLETVEALQEFFLP